MSTMTGQQGYVALLTVLIVGAVSAAICLALLSTGVDSQRDAYVLQRSLQARGLLHACAEEGLQAIHDDINYTGTAGMILGQGICGYTVTNTGATTRTITANATVNTVVRRAEVYVTIGSSSISITSWKEVN